MNSTALTPGQVLRRKESLGRAASFRELARKTKLPQTTIYVVVTERSTKIPISDEKAAEVLVKTSAALDQIEAEQAEHA